MAEHFSLPDPVLDAIRLNNTGHFFDAHEAFELAWRAADSPLKELIQVLLWVSVANYHAERRNMKGVRILVERSLSRLHTDKAPHTNIDIDALIQALQRTSDGLARRTSGEPTASPIIPFINFHVNN